MKKTLIYVICFLALLSILIAIWYYREGRYREYLNQKNMCAGNMRVLSHRIYFYKDNNGGKYPLDLEKLKLIAEINDSYFYCCAANIRSTDSYYVYRGNDLPSEAPDNMIVIHCRKPWHNGNYGVLLSSTDILFLDEKEMKDAITQDNNERKNLNLKQKPL